MHTVFHQIQSTKHQLLFILIALSLMLSLSKLSLAQPIEQPNKIYAIYQLFPGQYDDGSVKKLFEEVKKELTLNRYELEVTESTEVEPKTTAVLTFNLLGHTIYLELHKSPISAISPLFDEFSLTKDLQPEQADSSHSAVLAITATLLYAENQYLLAEKYMQRVSFSSYGETYNLQLFYGNCALLRKDYMRAIEDYRYLVTGYDIVGADDDIAPPTIAWSYMKLGQQEKALSIANKLVEWEQRIKDSERISQALANRAQLYNLAFGYDDAVKDLTTAIDLSPANPVLYTLRGQTYLLLYQWDNVLADYNKAIELDPTYADAYYFRGVLYYSILQTGQAMYNDALADFKHYLEIAPNGEHAADATRYAADIQTQINALNN
jgi:tetratricopeptide (TPR) repeat protein